MDDAEFRPYDSWKPGPPSDARETDVLAIISLICGVVSFLLCLGPLAAIPAIVTGHLANGRIRSDPARYGGSGMARAGLALGYINVVMMLLVVVAVLCFSFVLVRRAEVRPDMPPFGHHEERIVPAEPRTPPFKFPEETKAPPAIEYPTAGEPGHPEMEGPGARPLLLPDDPFQDEAPGPRGPEGHEPAAPVAPNPPDAPKAADLRSS